MPLIKIRIDPGLFQYRCDSCPYVYPKNPVKELELLLPPSDHQCDAPAESMPDTEDILERGE